MGLVMLMSAVMTGTLAWQDYSQHRTNEFTGTPQLVKVMLNKFEKDLNGNPTTVWVAGAEFYLYKQGEGDLVTQIGDERYTTGQNGQITVYGLKQGSYYFLETNPSYAYTYDKDGDNKEIRKYYFTVDGSQGNNIITVNAYNRRIYADLTITKTVKNQDNASLSTIQKGIPFTFTVTFSEGGATVADTYAYKIYNADDTIAIGDQTIKSGGTFTLTHGQKAVITNLPAGVHYTVVETPVKGFKISSNNHDNNIPPEGITADFTNIYDGTTLLTGFLNVSKTVTGPGAETDKDFTFTVIFSDGKIYDYKVDGTTKTPGSAGDFTLRHNQTAVFENLPAGITYSVSEDDYRPDYVTVKPNNSTGLITKDGAMVSFTNHKIQGGDSPGFLSVTKQVAGSGGEKDRLFYFTVNFDGAGGHIAPETYTCYIGGEARTFTNGGKISLKHGETAIFTGLPAGLHYTAVEDDYSAQGYTASVDNPAGVIRPNKMASITFTNNKPDIPDDKTTALIVKKKVAGEIPANDAGREFGFTVIIDGVETKFALKNGQQREFALRPGAVYQVLEDDCYADGYIQSTVINGYGTAAEAVIEVVKTNTYVGTVMIDIKGVKTWDMTADETAAKPDSITVYLKDGDKIADRAVVSADKNGEWNYVFTAPKYDKDGKIIRYTVEEAPVDGFISTVDKDNHIKNTYISPAAYMPSVKKTIAGDHPDIDASFTFILAAQDDAPLPAGSSNGRKTVIITGANERDFGKIIFTRAGTYTYFITEIKGNAEGYAYDESAYTLTVAVEQQGSKLAVQSAVYIKAGDTGSYDKAEFTNAYNKPVTTSVKVTKVWTGVNANQPAEVKAQLYKDGAAYGDPVGLNSGNKWSYTWSGLPGDAAWTVDEPNVPTGYTKTVTGNAAAGFVITNSTRSNEWVTVNGSKIWRNGLNRSPPAGIKIYIKNGDTVIAEKTVTAADHWHWAFKLPKYAPDGSTIKYTVDEEPVNGYTKTVDGYDIINTHDTYEEVTLSGKKSWDHVGNTSDLPGSITVYVKDGNAVVVEKKITAADGWRWSFRLPKYNKSGKVIEYTIDEANVPYYTMTRSGNDLHNKFKGFDYPGDSPKTGDTSSIWLWIILMGGSAAALVTMMIMSRKRAKKAEIMKMAKRNNET